MRFIARHISFQEIDGVRIFALGDKAGLPNEEQPEAFVILQFGDEADQDRALGLTGLHIETSAREPHGYGKSNMSPMTVATFPSSVGMALRRSKWIS
jgi:hypothetical protein